jgi:hypothetical protein
MFEIELDTDRRTDTERVLPVVALLVLVLLAGCSGAEGGLRMSAVNDTQLAANASHSFADAQLGDSEKRLVRETLETGTASATAVDQPVFEPLQERPVRYHGRYYNLTWHPIRNQPGASVHIRVNYTDSAGVPTERRVAYEDLPAGDREALRPFLPMSGDRSLWKQGDWLERSITYTADELNRSVIVDPQQYDAVVYDDTVYPVESLTVDRRTVTTYRYRAIVVAENRSAFADRVTERYAFRLQGLNESERMVVTEAINGSYAATGENESAFRAVATRFESHRAVERDAIHGEWVVRYRDTIYWATLRFGSLPIGPSP